MNIKSPPPDKYATVFFTVAFCFVGGIISLTKCFVKVMCIIMFNPKDYSDTFIIKKEREDYVLKEYIGATEGTLTIPEGITRISQYAFSENKCLKINKIVFPSTLKRIPSHNFQFWKHLETVVIPEGIKTIGTEAFMGTGLREVLLPSSIEKIESYAFTHCRDLEKITLLHISDSILNSLMNNSYSSSFSEPKLDFKLLFGVSGDIDLTPFFQYFNPRNEKLKFSIKNWFILYDDYIVGYIGDKTTLETPETSIGIAYEAFLNNKKIKKITLTSKIKVIGSSAFEGCSALRDITLNDNLEKINDYAFADSGIEKIRIPKKVNYVGEKAFYNCYYLKKFIIVKALYGDYYRTDNWNLYWNFGCNAPKDYDYESR